MGTIETTVPAEAVPASHWVWEGRFHYSNVDGLPVAGIGPIRDIDAEVHRTMTGLGLREVTLRVTSESSRRGPNYVPPLVVARAGQGAKLQCRVDKGTLTLGAIVANCTAAGRTVRVEVWRDMPGVDRPEEAWVAEKKARLASFIESAPHDTHFTVRDLVGECTSARMQALVTFLQGYVARGLLTVTDDGKRRHYMRQDRWVLREQERLLRFLKRADVGTHFTVASLVNEEAEGGLTPVRAQALGAFLKRRVEARELAAYDNAGTTHYVVQDPREPGRTPRST